MASAEQKLDEKSKQTLQQAIQLKFNNNETTIAKSNSAIGNKLVIPQLRIPALRNTGTVESLAAQEEHRQAANAHNELLLNEIKRRRQEQGNSNDNDNETSESLMPCSSGRLLNGLSGGFSIPKLRTATGMPLEEPLLNIPLLNQLRTQGNRQEQNHLVQSINKLKIKINDQPEQQHPALDDLRLGVIGTTTRPPSKIDLIDLTTTVIDVCQDAVPREAATKLRHKQLSAAVEHFDIPFIRCDSLRTRISKRLFSAEVESEDMDIPCIKIVEKSSVVGRMLDLTVGYPKPRQPQLKYAVTPLELQNLKLYKRSDYGSNIKRFRFDTPSPDELVKSALQKSWRISRT